MVYRKPVSACHAGLRQPYQQRTTLPDDLITVFASWFNIAEWQFTAFIGKYLPHQVPKLLKAVSDFSSHLVFLSD